MAHKVTFDWANKIIQVTAAPIDNTVNIDVKIDIFSDGKEDWKTDPDLNKFRFPITAVGGNPLPGSKSLGSTFFLEYGWVIRPYDANHIMNINGNMYARDGSNPYIATLNPHNVQIIQSVSSLVDSTVQQLAEIEHSTFADGVTIDTSGSNTGTAYPIGTPGQPVNNLSDAQTICSDRGFSKLFVRGNITLDSVADLTDFIVFGQNAQISTINVLASANVSNTEFQECTLTGELDGGSLLRNGVAYNLNYLNGFLFQCMIQGTLTLGGGSDAHLFDCFSGTPGLSTPIIDLGGSGQPLALRGYSGGIKLINKSGPESVSLDFESGQAIIDETVTNGTIVVRGITTVADNSTGTAVVNTDSVAALTSTVGQTVWEHQINGVISGSFGEAVRTSSFMNTIWLDTNGGTAGTAYPIGTPSLPVNNILDAITIGTAEGIYIIKLAEDAIVPLTANLNGFTIEGAHTTKSEIIIAAGATTQFSQFKNCYLKGTLNGWVVVRDSMIEDCFGVQGIFHNTMVNPGTIQLAGIQTSHFLSCYSGVPGTSTPELDFNGSGRSVAIRDYSGGIKLTNKTGIEAVSVDMNTGNVILDATVTNGEIVVRGPATLVDNSVGTTIVTTGLMNNESISDAVHDEAMLDHLIAGSFGQWINEKGLTKQDFAALQNL